MTRNGEKKRSGFSASMQKGKDVSAIAAMFNQPVISHKANRLVVSGKNATRETLPPLPDAAEREKVKQSVKKLSNRKRYREYYERNKEWFTARQKEYAKANKEAIAEYNKEYREKNKERLAALNKHWKEKRKQDPEYVARKNEQNRLYYLRKKHERKTDKPESNGNAESAGNKARGPDGRFTTAPRLQAVAPSNATISAPNV